MLTYKKYLFYILIFAGGINFILGHQQILERADQIQLFSTLFTQDPIYARDFAERLNKVIGVFHNLVSDDLVKQVEACLAFPFQTLEEPYNQTLQEVIQELVPMYYSTQGLLENITAQDISKRNFCIAKFLKQDLDYSNYKRLLHMFGFDDVLEYEDNTSTYVWNTLCNFASGSWLPTLHSYPDNMLVRIQTNPANKVLARVHTLCSKHQYAQAHELLKDEKLPLCTLLFEHCYNAFKKTYCDEDGVLKKY